MPDHPSVTSVADQDEVSFLLNLVRMIVRRRRLVIFTPLGAAILSGLIAYLVLPDTYTASARIMPPSPGTSASAAMMGQMGGVSAAALNMFSVRNPSAVYVAMLRSRTIADALIAKFNLGTWYGTEYPTKTRRVLANHSAITFTSDGVINIEVDDVDPLRAMEMANTYVDELNRLTHNLTLSEASQRRIFYEQQLSQVRAKLAEAENRAHQAMSQGGLVNVTAQGQALVETTARLRGQISATEVKIAAMRGYATDTNPAMRQAQFQLAALRQELAKSEGTRTGKTEPSAADNDNLRLLREVKYNETLVELIAKQYELAKIDEAKDPGSLQVLDRPVQPDLPSGPNRIAIILIITLLAASLALLLAYLLDAIARVKAQLPATPGLADKAGDT